MFKKIVCFIAAFAIAVIPVFAETDQTEQLNITTTSYVIYNPDNNEVVEGKDYDKVMYPASLTKMLTALTVVGLSEDVKTETVTVSAEAISLLSGTNSSKAGIRANEIFTVEQLLYLMLLPSGNDAANVLAEHFSNEQTSFVDEMNKKAQSLGMKNSHFVNPHGLHDDNHYSTATDLALVADAFLDDPLLSEIASSTEYRLPVTEQHAEYWVRNTNLMMIAGRYFYEFATGLKTGYTDKAGRCLAASAEKDGERYICILLFTPEVWDSNGLVRTEFMEAAALFDYAFENYECVKIASKNQKITDLLVFETKNQRVDLVLKNDIYVTLKTDTDLNDLKIDFTPQNLMEGSIADSPVKSGQSFGKATLSIDGKSVEFEVVAANTVEADKKIVLWHKMDSYVYIALGIIAFLILFVILLIIRKKVVLYNRKKALKERLKRFEQKKQAFAERQPYDYFKMD